MYDNTMWGFCQDSARRFLAQRLILFQDGVQPQLPGAGQQVAVAAQKGLPLVDALFDEVGVHLKVEHHRVPPQAEQALLQLFLQLGVIALVLLFCVLKILRFIFNIRKGSAKDDGLSYSDSVIIFRQNTL